ncbi:MAG: GNAT family N-acetyltransferase [Lachnospiraceae bacterium]|nr:GNAT family N-acetyltransferase [Lachnospiraceae bacterium]
MITLQPVTRENYNECLALERAQFDFVGDATAVLANAYIYRDSSLAYAVCEEDTVIGMVLLDETGKDGSYEFTDLFIADNYRNQGYGDKAVKAILSHFSRKGATHVHMQVHKDNKAAIHVYKKNGFSIKGTSPWDENFIVMELSFY